MSSDYVHAAFCTICKIDMPFIWDRRSERDSLLCADCPKPSVPRERATHFTGEPQNHGNPIDPSGSAVTFHYGYDFPELISNWTGFDIKTVRFWDHRHGVLGEMTEVYICRKPMAERDVRRLVAPGFVASDL